MLTNQNKAVNTEVRFDSPLESYTLYTAPLRLQQVIINLLNKHRNLLPKAEASYWVSNRRDDGYVLFSVTDTGCGIPDDKQELVFNRFVKLNEFVQGTGLGLSICKLTIQQMGGDIWIDRNYKNGTRFVFSHPIKKREEENTEIQ